MAVMGCDFTPTSQRDGAGPKPALWGRGNAHPLAGVGSYAFLDETPKWTAEELCLAYALTEPSLCSVQITGDRVERIEQLAASPSASCRPTCRRRSRWRAFRRRSGGRRADVALDRRRQAS